ncbi:MerR family transcriptional regulator [Nocardia sp. alder85J]|uniref:MerR family transcriptional regulator n=1 Tax=Nocardia sp. alder85J TaxID=2862949 RepID=UPI001CD348C0|nr:MerR family transcriptional regulator [Nocardia sp. alder85J]MCX4096415.1 MerR family transcriptional regulator [Nocardia sp. alder85J]
MLIGELAARTGTTTRALRFYEEQGLLTAGRTPAGYRDFEEQAVLRVRNIRELLSIGFTVEDVRAFLPYLDQEVPEVFPYEPRCATGYARVGPPRVAELDRRIAALTELRNRLVARMPWLAGEVPCDSTAAERAARPAPALPPIATPAPPSPRSDRPRR